ncbi:hypothetical protein PFISCL1PPCAC_4225, partial [Pristionchus fissidentatus]
NASSSLPNLVLTSWMPQNDLLNDDRLTAFITHGGMGSTQETAVRGKPGVFIPLFGDQPRNAGMMEYNGVGKVVDKLDLVNPDIVEAAVKDVLANETCVYIINIISDLHGTSRYRKNVRRISKMLAKKPFKARELMIKLALFSLFLLL